jgi:hypothetical protein
MNDLCSQVVLYVGAPFYALPWKLAAFNNFVEKSSYEIAYSHFRRDHNTTLNLAFHMFALGLQLGGNAALLRCLDSKLSGSNDATKYLSILTGVAWSYLLAFCPSPLLVRGVSIALIWFAGSIAGFVEVNWLAVLVLQGLIEPLGIIYLLKTPLTISAYPLVASIRALLFYGVFQYRGSLQAYSMQIGLVLLAVMVSLAMKEDPLRGGLVFLGVFVTWILALLTDQPILFFYGFGFVATIAQGVAHEVSGEKATLVQLQEKSFAEKLPFEWSHVTYFPCLLLQSVHDSALGPTKP